MQKQIKNLLTLSLACATFAPALAHDGHGLSGSHWHTSDAWGFMALAAAVAAALWFSRGGK